MWDRGLHSYACPSNPSNKMTTSTKMLKIPGERKESLEDGSISAGLPRMANQRKKARK